MKIIFFSFLLILTFSACSHRNAFDSFALTPREKLAEDSVLNSKIKYKDEIDGVVSVVYLNAVHPDVYKHKEYFYIYLYLKDGKKLQFLLNKQKPIHVEELDAKNRFSKYMAFDAKWTKYYLVAFKKQQSDKLEFVVKDGKFRSNTLVYKKDQE